MRDGTLRCAAFIKGKRGPCDIIKFVRREKIEVLLRSKLRALIIAIFFITSFAMVCTAEENTRDDGIFSSGSFLSDAINSTIDKLSKVGAGEEKIVDDDAKGIPQDVLEYDGDPLHSRPLVKPSFRNKSNKMEN